MTRTGQLEQRVAERDARIAELEAAARDALNVLAMFEEPDMNVSAAHVYAHIRKASSRLRAALSTGEPTPRVEPETSRP